MKAFLTSLIASVFATASLAEDITINDADGTSWESYTTSKVCITSAVNTALGPESSASEIEDNIGGFTPDGASRSYFGVSFQEIANSSVVIVTFVSHTYEHNLGVEQERFGDTEFYRSQRSGVLTYKPMTVGTGVQPWGETVSLSTSANGAFTFSGFGESEYDVETPVIELDQSIRECVLTLG